jgi:NitT/TauT family transport system ATP-binding protein
MTLKPVMSIEFRNVSKRYSSRSGDVEALHDVSFGVTRGQFVSILGPSGCGKSTLLRIVAGLDRASVGTVRVAEKPVAGPQTQLGIMFQSPVLLEWRDALGNVMLQAEARRLERDAADKSARELLASVGLAGFEHKRPHELSGGMQQRVALCRTLLHDPETILMDEPFGALDALTRDQMNVDLQHLWKRGDKTVLFVTHSITEAVFLSDRVLVMSPSPGQISLDLAIDSPRPRRLAMRERPEFMTYVARIREILFASGVLREEE